MAKNRDRRMVLGILIGVVLCVVAFSFLAPAADDTDPSPTTYNAGSAGTKAAYLVLGRIGYEATRWDAAPRKLTGVDAAHTTLILAEPSYSQENAKVLREDVANFLTRGGRVVATGVGGAFLLPQGKAGKASRFYTKLCLTAPEGQGELARVGSVSTPVATAWTATGPEYRVAQRCGDDAVVVSYKYGAGEAVWWSSPMPLSNRGLKDDASLRLVLASVGEPGRRVLFDEYFHGVHESLWDKTKGLPIAQLSWQCALVAVLLVLSFGRRSGPQRMPLRVPRSSPLEFAESMGRLYDKAGATQAATEGARRRLMKYLAEQCGVPRDVLRSGPESVAEALQVRLGGDWTRVGTHLAQAAEAEYNELAVKSALELVKALDRDQQDLAGAIRSGRIERMTLKGAIASE